MSKDDESDEGEEERDDGDEEEEEEEGERDDEDQEEEDSEEEVVEPIFTHQEFTKAPKSRRTLGSAILPLDNLVSEFKFQKAVWKKVMKFANASTTIEDLRTYFSIVRHVPDPLELGDDSATFQYMLKTAVKMGDPAVNLLIELPDDGSNLNDEPETAKNKKKGRKSEVPSEKDINPTNASINLKIQLLRNKWICNDADGSQYCWPHPEGKHVPLSHTHFRTWAAAWEQNECDSDKPPNHHPFDLKAIGTPSLLQQRIAAQANTRNGNFPVINNHFTIPDALLELLPRAAQPPASAPVLAFATAPLSDMLLPVGTEPGPKLLIADFCRAYELDDSVLKKLADEGYKTTASFRFVLLQDLVRMSFRSGEIAELREAVMQWAVRR
ncbi:hypothetical protein GGX14DRAFT_580821 [Mycena pura]|uniref:Uncharacterized protein n=1 Tax=Mycena pura TaxID=153505 RepID=A0AAD6UKL7_9AGAR|nr:hypothetical protein GGX14DRAFT_580821 [Mycena pura]